MTSELFKPNAYLTPSTEEEVSELLKRHGDKAKIIAGGTGIYEVAHRGLLSDVQVLIDISQLGLEYVKLSSDGSGASLVIGSCATMSELLGSKELSSKQELGALIDALRIIHPTQVKNVATIGGAICTALPFFDLPVALLCLNAGVVVSPSGDLRALSDFIQGYFSVNLGAGEFVREVVLRLSEGENTASSFKKFALTGDDWALVNSGACIALDESGKKIHRATISIGGGVGEKPVLAKKTSTSILGIEFSDEVKLKALIDSEMEKDIEPVTDIRASAEYRLKIAKVFCRRAVLEACKRASGERNN